MIESNRLLIATTNRKKGGEMLQILQAALPEVVMHTLADFPKAPEVEEVGDTFLENAHLKARAAVNHTGLISIADDGGLCIDALDGQPGVKSHRFLGEDTSFAEKMDRILEMLQNLPDEQRACRFRCVVVIAVPDGREFSFEGTCEGRIARERRGENGFGYDPIFYLPELDRHMAELAPEQKHRLSHRGRSLAAAIPCLQMLFR